MARIQQIKHPDGDVIYPISHTNAIIDDSGNRLENVLQDLKLNSSIWNIESGSGVFVNRPDLLVDIKLGSGVWIGSDVYIASGFDSRKTAGELWSRYDHYVGVGIGDFDIKLGTGVHIGTDSAVMIGKYTGIVVYTGDSNDSIYIGSGVYIEPGFDSRNISGGSGSGSGSGDGLWKVEGNLLTSKSSNRNIQLGTEIVIGTNGSVTIDGDFHGIQVYTDNNQSAIVIGTKVKIGTSNESIEITQMGIRIDDTFGDKSIFIGSQVHISAGFDSRKYLNSDGDLNPESIPTDSSLKNSSKLAVNIEPQSNGNIKIGDTLFMPATPSGDPMHYAYETAGAEYNATTGFIVKNAPWKDMVDTIEDKAKWGFDVVDASQVKQMTIGGTIYNYVQTTRQSPEGTTEPRYYLVGQASDGTWVEDETKVLHLPGHWYLNGLGDITNVEMGRIYRSNSINATFFRGLQDTKARTIIFDNKYIQIVLGTISIYSDNLTSFIAPPQAQITAPRYLDTFLAPSTKYCNKLIWDKETNINYIPISNTSQARVFYLRYIAKSLQILSKYLSKLSIIYMIYDVSPTTPITITLHADRYAQLAEDADIVAALEGTNVALEGTGGSVSLVSA